MGKCSDLRHIGFIPDGNRRWAVEHGLAKEIGYAHGIAPGLQLYEICKRSGIGEVSNYCFTQDNTMRPSVHKVPSVMLRLSLRLQHLKPVP